MQLLRGLAAGARLARRSGSGTSSSGTHAAARRFGAPRVPCALPQQHYHHQQQQRRRVTAAAAAPDAPAPATAPAQAAPANASASSGHAPGPDRPAPPLSQSRFCRQCGSPMEVIRPEGDSEWRHVCTSCKYVDYFNPKMVVGCIVEHAGKLLLCRRAIEPCLGKWTVPAGFLELGESTAAGAARETMEEAGAKVDVLAPFYHLDIPAIGQSYLLFRARLAPPFSVAPSTPESLETRLVAPEDLPWADLAFSSVAVALRAYVDDMARAGAGGGGGGASGGGGGSGGGFGYHHATIRKRVGSAPNDPSAFEVVDHFELKGV